MATKRYVRESRDGGWQVLKEGQRRSGVQTPTKQAALARARAIVKKSGGGEIRVVNRVGKVVESKTIRRAPLKRAS
jgi:hypothetical protein